MYILGLFWCMSQCYMPLFMYVLGGGDERHGESVFWQAPSICAACYRALFMNVIWLFSWKIYMYLEEVMGVMDRVCFGKHHHFVQHIIGFSLWIL